MKTSWIKNILVVLVILFIVSIRFMTIDIPNFAPIAAAGIVGIYHFKNKMYGFLLPIAALFASDIILQATIGYGLYLERMVDYFGFFVAIAIGFFIFKRWKQFPAVLGATVGGSLAFFFISNFGVWAFGTIYPKTFMGLMTCFEMGIPFYKNSLLGDLFFVTVFFGLFEFVSQLFPQENMDTSVVE